jgi:hypothetical protein
VRKRCVDARILNFSCDYCTSVCVHIELKLLYDPFDMGLCFCRINQQTNIFVKRSLTSSRSASAPRWCGIGSSSSCATSIHCPCTIHMLRAGTQIKKRYQTDNKSIQQLRSCETNKKVWMVVSFCIFFWPLFCVGRPKTNNFLLQLRYHHCTYQTKP